MYRKQKNSRIIKKNKKNNNLKLFGGTNNSQESKDNFYSILDSEDSQGFVDMESINNRQQRNKKLKEKFALYDDKEAAHKAAYNAIIDNEDRQAASKAASDAMNAANLRGQLLSNLGKKSLEMLLADLEKEKKRIESITNKILMELDKKQAEEIANAAILDDKDREAASYAAYNAKLAESDKLAAFNAANDALMEIKKQKRLKKRNKIAKKKKLVSKDIIEQKEDLQNQLGVIESKEDEDDYAMQWEKNIEDKISDYMNKYPILRISAIKMTQYAIDPNNASFLDNMMNQILHIDEIMQNEGVSWKLATIYYDKPNMSEKEKKEMVKHDIVLSSMTPSDERHGDEESIRPKMTESDKNIHKLMRQYRISRKTAKIFHENPDWSEDKKSRISAEDPVTQDAKMRELNFNRDSAKDLLSNPTDDIDTLKQTISKDPFFQNKIENLMNEFHCSYDTAMFMLTKPNATQEEINETLRNDKKFASYSKMCGEHALFLRQQEDIKRIAAQKKEKSKAKRSLRRKRK